jgi:hypothetical protein
MLACGLTPKFLSRIQPEDLRLGVPCYCPLSATNYVTVYVRDHPPLATELGRSWCPGT